MSSELNGFLEYVLDQLSGWGGVSSRRMFGGVGLYRDGKMFALISDDVAYLKADHTNRYLFERVGSAPFKPYRDKQVTMSYYEVPAEVLEDPEQLIQWSECSLAIQKKTA